MAPTQSSATSGREGSSEVHTCGSGRPPEALVGNVLRFALVAVEGGEVGLEREPVRPKHVKTEPGVGYRLEDEA